MTQTFFAKIWVCLHIKLLQYFLNWNLAQNCLFRGNLGHIWLMISSSIIDGFYPNKVFWHPCYLYLLIEWQKNSTSSKTLQIMSNHQTREVFIKKWILVVYEYLADICGHIGKCQPFWKIWRLWKGSKWTPHSFKTQL